MACQCERTEHFCFVVLISMLLMLQSGPLPVISRGYNPSYSFIRPTKRVIIQLITGRVPSCMIFQPFNDSFFWRMLDVKHQLRNINYETRRGWFQGMWEVLFACYLFCALFFSSSFWVFLGVFSYVPTWNFSEGWSFFWRFLWLLSGIWREFLVEGNTLGFGGLLCTAVLPWLP